MMTNVNKEAMDLKFSTKLEANNLIIQAQGQNDRFIYVVEILANPFINFDRIKEYLDQKMFRITAKTQEKLNIEIGATPLKMTSKLKVQSNKLRELQHSFQDQLLKLEESRKIIDSLKEKIAIQRNLVTELQRKNIVLKLNGNIFQATVQNKVKDENFNRSIIQNPEVNNSKGQVQLETEQSSQCEQKIISPNPSVKTFFSDQSQQQKDCLKDFNKKVENDVDIASFPKRGYNIKFIYTNKENQQQDLLTPQQNYSVEQIKLGQNQKINTQLYEKLYQHIEKTISKEQFYYGKSSQKYFKKAVSQKELEEETVKYPNYLKQNIESLPPQHQEQLSFLIDIFDSQNKCIINWYRISSKYQASNGPAKFVLSFAEIKQRIDLKQLLSFNNWNHLVALWFYNCGWFNDDDWRALVEHAAHFNNLKHLYLNNNKISSIKEGDIEQFKSLESIDLRVNPLSGQSKEMLQNIKQKNNKYQFSFDN